MAGGRKIGVIVGLLVLVLVVGAGAFVVFGGDDHGRRPDQVIPPEQDATGPVSDAVWSEDGSTLYVAHDTGIDVLRGSPLVRTGRIESSLFPAAATWSPDHTKVVLSDIDGNTEVWDLTTAGALPDLDGPPASFVAWSPDGEQIATTGPDVMATIFDVDSGEVATSFEFTDSGLGRKGLAWPTADQLLTVTGNLVTTVHPATGEIIWSHHTGPWALVSPSPDGAEAVIGMNNDDHDVYDLATGEVVGAVRTASRVLKAADWSPDGRWVLVAGDDDRPTLWDAAAAETTTQYEDLGPYGAGGAWSPDSRRVAVTDTFDQRVLIIDPTGTVDDEELSIAEDKELEAAAWSPAGDRLAAVSYEGTVFVWDVTT